MIISYYPGAGGNRFLHYCLMLDYKTPNRSYDDDSFYKLYKKLNISINSSNKYLNEENYSTDYKYILTHCTNIEKILSLYPNDNEIVYIDADLKESLSRQWGLLGKRRFLKTEYKYSIIDVYREIKKSYWPDLNSVEEILLLPDNIQKIINAAINGNLHYSGKNFLDVNSAFELIKYHAAYYNEYPTTALNTNNVKIINCKFITDNSSEFEKTMISELSNYSNSCFDFCWNVYFTQGADAPIIDLWQEHLNSID